MVDIQVKDMVRGEIVFSGKSKKELAEFINYTKAGYVVDERATYDNMAYVLQPHYRIIRNGKEIMY